MLSKRFVKKQSMQWTKRGVHLLLQTRVKTLNNELAATFRHWYPDFQVRVARSPAPHYPQAPSDQAHSRLTSAITAPQTPRWRPPAAGDCTAQPLPGTRRAALLGTCARARATLRYAPSPERKNL